MPTECARLITRCVRPTLVVDAARHNMNAPPIRVMPPPLGLRAHATNLGYMFVPMERVSGPSILKQLEYRGTNEMCLFPQWDAARLDCSAPGRTAFFPWESHILTYNARTIITSAHLL
jgi:hypothetical protein